MPKMPITLADVPWPLPYGLQATMTGTFSAPVGRKRSTWIVTPSRRVTGTSLSSTMSMGSGLNGGAIWKPASNVRVPGSKLLRIPYLSPGSSGREGM